MNVDTGQFAALTAEAEALRAEAGGMRQALRQVFRYGVDAGRLIAAGHPGPADLPARRRDHLTIVR